MFRPNGELLARAGVASQGFDLNDPSIINTEHNLRFTLGSALIQLYRETVIGLGDEDGLKLPLGIITGNSHGG